MMPLDRDAVEAEPMRPTMIVHAHPETFRFLSKDCQRLTGTCSTLPKRFYAAWLVYTGRADALSWEWWENRDRRVILEYDIDIGE
jgi:hypothetical protein